MQTQIRIGARSTTSLLLNLSFTKAEDYSFYLYHGVKVATPRFRVYSSIDVGSFQHQAVISGARI